MEILDLIDELEEIVIQARRLPVGGNLVVDRKRVLDVIDQMRLALPADVLEAKRVLETREELVAEADARARQMIEHADAERARRLDEDSILREARSRSQTMLHESETQARQTLDDADSAAAAHLSEAAEAATRQLDDADEYSVEVLRRLDSQLQAFLDSIRANINSLKQRR